MTDPPAGRKRRAARVGPGPGNHPEAGTDRLDEAVRRYKDGLEHSDARPLREFLDGLSPLEREALAEPVSDFLKSERARLVKLRTLGLSKDYEPRIRMTEDLIAHLGRTAK